MYAATQQSRVCEKPVMSNIVETRSKKLQRTKIVQTRSKKQPRTTTTRRGGMFTKKSTKRQTRSTKALPVQQPPTLPAHASQLVQAPKARQAPELPPPRIRSQRMLQKRLSAPRTGHRSSKDNGIVIE